VTWAIPTFIGGGTIVAKQFGWDANSPAIVKMTRVEGDHIVVLTEDSVVWIFAYAPDVRDYLAVRIENYVTPVLASNGNHLSVMGNMSV